MTQPTAAGGETEQLNEQAMAAFRRGDNIGCRRLSEEALRAATDAGNERGQALSHLNLARAALRDGAHLRSIDHATAADRHAVAAGAHDLRITALHLRAESTRAAGDYSAAVPLYEQLLATNEERVENDALAMEHYNLACVLIQKGDRSGSRRHLDNSLRLCPAKPAQLQYTLLGYAGWLARYGDPATAGKVLGAVEAHLAGIGEVLDPAETQELATHVGAAQARDAGAFDVGRRVGASLTLADAQALVEAVVAREQGSHGGAAG